MFPLPDGFAPVGAAPLLCGGAIGLRALRISGIQPGGRLGLYGFGASATCAIQIARQAFLNALTQTVPKGVGEALFDAVANSVKVGFRFILAVGIVAVVLAFLTRHRG